MSARYAIYYAPSAGHPLTAAASAWLGRNAWTGHPVVRPAVAGLDLGSEELDALTQEPRHYGFHATLKAPFELAEGQTEAMLMQAFAEFAAAQSAFDGGLEVRSLSGFIALTLNPPCPPMHDLHTACVSAFEPFRALLSDADLARRRRSPMTADQDARLVRYGYPWIFEDFRFHMTLTRRIADDAQREAIIAALAQHFAPAIGQHRFETLCLFRQVDRKAPFTVLQACELSAAQAPSRTV